MKARRNRRVWGASAGVLVLALAAYGTADALDRVPGVLTLAPEVLADPLPHPTVSGLAAGSSWDAEALAAAPADAPVPQGLAGILDPMLDDDRLTGPVGAEIRDAATGEVLYARNPDAGHTPASTTKIVTAAAALGTLGSQTTFTTSARASAVDAEAGTAVVHLVGGGDVLLGTGASDATRVNGRAGLATLAADAAEALGEAGVTRVELAVDTSRYTGPAFNAGWERVDISNGFITRIVPLMVNSGATPAEGDHARSQTPEKDALAAFATALTDAGITVTGQRDEPVPAPADAVDLAAVESAPVSAVTEYFLQHSDNVVAEVVGREVALALGHEGSGAAAPGAVLEALGTQGLDAGSIHLADVSGLDYANRISAHDLVSLLGAAAQSDGDLSLLAPALPVAGLTGTLAERFVDEESRAGAGVVRAKTGTLSTVTSLGGTILTADDRLLVFAVLSSNLQRGTAGGARTVLDDAVARVAACGCS